MVEHHERPGLNDHQKGCRIIYLPEWGTVRIPQAFDLEGLRELDDRTDLLWEEKIHHNGGVVFAERVDKDLVLHILVWFPPLTRNQVGGRPLIITEGNK